MNAILDTTMNMYVCARMYLGSPILAALQCGLVGQTPTVSLQEFQYSLVICLDRSLFSSP